MVSLASHLEDDSRQPRELAPADRERVVMLTETLRRLIRVVNGMKHEQREHEQAGRKDRAAGMKPGIMAVCIAIGTAEAELFVFLESLGLRCVALPDGSTVTACQREASGKHWTQYVALAEPGEVAS